MVNLIHHIRRPYALSWKPCQGDSLTLPDHRYIFGVAASFQLSRIHKPHDHTQAFKVNQRFIDWGDYPCLSFHFIFAMSTQQDIYATGFENRPPILNKENYVPWSSRLLRYAKSRQNRKLIHNSIINGPYVRRMILEPGDPNREVPVNETFHVQTDDELTEKELKQIESDDQAIQTILLGLPEDIYAAVDSCETS
nr:ribonuclease H-like domain-containing protein [Tanacetum cinerariifolium]